MGIINTQLLAPRNIAVIVVFAFVALYVARHLLPHPATTPPDTAAPGAGTTFGMTGAGVSAGSTDVALNLGDPDAIY